MNGPGGIYDLGLKPLATDILYANPAQTGLSGGTTANVNTAVLTPAFMRIEPQGHASYPVTQLATRVTTASVANTFGQAVYSIVYTDATHWTATLECQLNAAGSTATAIFVKGDVTTGAAGSGAGVCTLDFTTKRYIIGGMSSDLTAQFQGITGSTTQVGFGYLRWSAAARASTTDWPTSFTETSSATMNTTRIMSGFLVTATGKILP